MTLEDLLWKKKDTILQGWFHAVLAVYPGDTQTFLKKQRNRFANPVGRTILEGLEALFEQLIHGRDPATISNFLYNIIRIRAVQDLSPSQAIAFIPRLKTVIREELRRDILDKGLVDQLVALESSVDEMTLVAFDIYMKCRERIYEIKANDLNRRTRRLLKKTDLFDEMATLDWKSEEKHIKDST